MSYRCTFIRIATAIMVCLLAISYPGYIRADENLFGYVYGTDTLPAGRNEIYT